MRTKGITLSVASVLAVAVVELLSVGPASAAPALARATLTVEAATTAPATSTMPQSAVRTCAAAAKSSTFTAATRLDWCAAFSVILTVYEDDEPVGTATVAQVDYASWKVSSRTWNKTNQLFSEVDSTGVLVGEVVTVTALSSCSKGCKITSGHSYILAIPESPAVGEKKVGVTSPGKATVTSHLKTTWEYEADGLPAVPPAEETTVGVRCDSQHGYRYASGCANPSYTPTYVLSSAAYPAIAKFDKAELAKHPSWKTLTRVSPVRTSANRRVVCKGFKPVSKTDSCDEFPYASTAQGGKGAAREHVNVTENKAQGANLGAFYNANRLFYGEKFHVLVS
jgi:Deoxyribonuclease NucA/NucB